MQVCFVMEQTLQWSALPFTVWAVTVEQTKAYPAPAAVAGTKGRPCGGGKLVPYQQAGAQGLPKPQGVELDRLCWYQID